MWHVTREPVVLDTTRFKNDDRYAATPYRSSTTPVLVGLTLKPMQP